MIDIFSEFSALSCLLGFLDLVDQLRFGLLFGLDVDVFEPFELGLNEGIVTNRCFL